MANKSLRLIFLTCIIPLAAGLLLAGCSALTSIQPPAPTAVETPVTPTPTSVPVTPVPTPENNGLIPIAIWLPPQFDPDLNTPASRLLKERLEIFNLEHPNLAVSYRIKEETGPAGLLDALSSTGKVAPQALPDLVLFPNSELQTAIERSLVYPYPYNIPSNEDPDWYEVAGEIGKYQEQRYNLPMAVDAQVIVYNTRLVDQVPANWDELLRSGYLLSFPLAEPKAAITLALYRSQGGALQLADNTATLEVAPLTNVLSFYAQAKANNLLPDNVTQIETEQAAWDRFRYGSWQAVITTASRVLSEGNEDFLSVPLLGEDGSPISLVSGWGWTLTNPDPNKQVAAAELARYLTDSVFIGAWTEAAGLLPLRPQSLDVWTSESARTMADQLLLAAQPMPRPNTLSWISPLLHEAVINTLSGKQSAEEAAQNAVDSLQN